ncbi:FIST N-terminal domain-containing protein [Fulvivirgaceae bacterium BMA10]|uniref:FIST N-terminal domain-containing protein n=1 Tax=Splendidivirga corallicola TaxID=3051826 RepID=A0ABT8KSR6_9BACT|nr:FIST N-terminal domain-containing protein [Fulvivirgaceae bacterium BMA10]
MYLDLTHTKDIYKAIRSNIISDQQVVMILVAENSQIDLLALIKEFNKEGIQFFGGVFPGLIYNNEKLDKGLIFKVLPVLFSPFLIRDIDKDNQEIPALRKILNKSGQQRNTAIVLIDGQTPNVAGFLAKLCSELGGEVDYFGGGAGSLTVRQPCIFSNEGLLQNAAIVGFINRNVALGVGHGLPELKGPMISTKTTSNCGHETTIENKEVLEYDTCVHLPYDIADKDLESKPTNQSEAELLLIDGAKHAAMESLKKGDQPPVDYLVIDSVSRVLFLNERFDEELQMVDVQLRKSESSASVEGILSIGEITSCQEGKLTLFNGKILVGSFYEDA